jgi:hypothetical protein
VSDIQEATVIAMLDAAEAGDDELVQAIAALKPEQLQEREKVQPVPSHIRFTTGEQGTGTVVEAIDSRTGKEVGSALVEDYDKEGKVWHVTEVHVKPEYRRQGIASGMYDFMERHYGVKLAPNDSQTEDGRSLWQGRRKAISADTATAAVKQHAGQYNFAKLVDVRRAMGGSKAEQDAALVAAWRAGKIGGIAFEGRHQVPGEVDALLDFQGERITAFRVKAMHKALRKGQPTDAFDDEARTIDWIMTTETQDRDGETVDPEGGQFTDFLRNPAVQFNHDTDDFPIGKLVGEPWNEMVGEGTKYASVGGPQRMALIGKVQFSKENPKGDLAYRMAREGTLGGGSISFLPVGGADKNAQGGNHYSRWKLLEFTICPVGSNPDAVALAKKLRSVQKSEATFKVTPAEYGRFHKAATELGLRLLDSKPDTTLGAGFVNVVGTPEAIEELGGTWKRQAEKRKYITHTGSKWVVHAESGKVLGTHDTKADAERQLRAVEANNMQKAAPYEIDYHAGRYWFQDKFGRERGPYNSRSDAEAAAAAKRLSKHLIEDAKCPHCGRDLSDAEVEEAERDEQCPKCREQLRGYTLKGAAMKRKLWTNGSKAWLLKSEGDVDPATQEYLEERGLDDVRVEESEPGSAEWKEEERREPEHQKSLDVGPPGQRALKRMIKYIEDETRDVEKSEVLDAAQRALKEFRKALERGYKDAGDEPLTEPEAKLKEALEDGVEEGMKIGMTPDEAYGAVGEKSGASRSLLKRLKPHVMKRFVQKAPKPGDTVGIRSIRGGLRWELVELNSQGKYVGSAGYYKSQEEAESAARDRGYKLIRLPDGNTKSSSFAKRVRKAVDEMGEEEAKRKFAEEGEDMDAVEEAMKALCPDCGAEPCTCEGAKRKGTGHTLDFNGAASGKFDVENIVVPDAEARRLWEHDLGDVSDRAAEECTRRGWKRPFAKSKRLSKADVADHEELMKFLDDAADNAPPHLAAGLRHHSEKIKQKVDSLAEHHPLETPMEMSEDEALAKMAEETEEAATEMSKSWYRATGVVLRN